MVWIRIISQGKAKAAGNKARFAGSLTGHYCVNLHQKMCSKHCSLWGYEERKGVG
jgi:hypothetical protein